MKVVARERRHFFSVLLGTFAKSFYLCTRKLCVSMRKYPIGIQTFSEVITGGYVYVDKTDLVWQLKEISKYVFLSRPRRFGKSLLSSTLESYFRGEKDLFEGLKIMAHEKEWNQHPVFRIDLSIAKGQSSADALRARLMLLLKDFTGVYGKDDDEVTPGGMMEGLIKRAYRKTGRQVVVIIDEYDAPLLDVLHEQDHLDAMRMVMQEFYQPLKACEAMVRFCFITGITKFSQLSIFSTLNNLKNISMLPAFSAICGITEEEVKTVFAEEISQMGQQYGYTSEQMFLNIKEMYDGYHFAAKSSDIYNPFSLLNAFADKELHDYWFATGTPSYLTHQLQVFRTDITAMDNIIVPSSAFDQPTENMQDALPLLYQCGYLTIKDYDRESKMYTLSIPNQEVRVGYTQGLLPLFVGLTSSNVQSGFALQFWKALKDGDADLAMREMQAYLAGIPYVEGFKKKLEDAATAEGFYEYTLYLIFSMLNIYVRTQVKCAKGRTDMVVWMPHTTYVFELKTNGTAKQALEQIETNQYALPYQAFGRQVVKIGCKFNVETRTLEDWLIKAD